MFYQARVPENQQDFLRLVWWSDGDTSAELRDYKMTVHPFGATSSPSCANFALRQTAVDNEPIYGAEAARTLQRNFYVDDLLKSVPTAADAIRL